jgi:hypothetical protein
MSIIALLLLCSPKIPLEQQIQRRFREVRIIVDMFVEFEMAINMISATECPPTGDPLGDGATRVIPKLVKDECSRGKEGSNRTASSQSGSETRNRTREEKIGRTCRRRLAGQSFPAAVRRRCAAVRWLWAPDHVPGSGWSRSSPAQGEEPQVRATRACPRRDLPNAAKQGG